MIFAAAKPADFAGIAALLAETDMPGWISLSYQADLAQLAGHPDGITQTAICNDEGRIVATASCTTLPSRQGPITWIGGLRIAESHRKRAGLMRNGLATIRAHLLGDPPDWQMAAVLSDNLPAQGLLSGRSDRFPAFRPVTGLTTMAMRTRAGKVPGVRRAEIADAPQIASILAREDRPLAPRIDATEDFADWRGLSVTDFLLAEQDGKVTGLVAVWDQRDSRRFVVTDYARHIRLLRPLWNVAAPLTKQPRLPPIGSPLNAAFLSFLTVDDAPTAISLVQAGLALAHNRGIGIANIGLADDDPLRDVLTGAFRHQPYRSTLYGVEWPGGRRLPPPVFFAQSKVELALL